MTERICRVLCGILYKGACKDVKGCCKIFGIRVSVKVLTGFTGQYRLHMGVVKIMVPFQNPK